MTIPNKDQVREALETGIDSPEAVERNIAYAKVFAVARAFVEGDLNPVEPDYEAALAELRRARPEWTPFVGDAFVIRNVVDAALAGKQETGRE